MKMIRQSPRSLLQDKQERLYASTGAAVPTVPSAVVFGSNYSNPHNSCISDRLLESLSTSCTAKHNRSRSSRFSFVSRGGVSPTRSTVRCIGIYSRNQKMELQRSRVIGDGLVCGRVGLVVSGGIVGLVVSGGVGLVCGGIAGLVVHERMIGHCLVCRRVVDDSSITGGRVICHRFTTSGRTISSNTLPFSKPISHNILARRTTTSHIVDNHSLARRKITPDRLHHGTAQVDVRGMVPAVNRKPTSSNDATHYRLRVMMSCLHFLQ